MVLAALGYFNYTRFGNVLQLGYTSNPNVSYGAFVAPWQGLMGLLLSSGKGLLWYCPVVMVGLILWRSFHTRFPALSITLLSAVMFRVCFIASRSDWHAGFSLGPRYLVLIVPLLILPAGETVAAWLRKEHISKLWLFSLLTLVFISEQLYFSVGEIFSFFHTIKWAYTLNGVDPFFHDIIYLDLHASPLLSLLELKRGPFLLRSLSMSNYALWGWTTVIAAGLLFCGNVGLLKRRFGRWHQ
jgi:hypothetical protein